MSAIRNQILRSGAPIGASVHLKFRPWLLSGVVAVACLAQSALAQIPVPAGGTAPIAFDTRPAASEWATHVRPGDGTTYTNVTTLDAGIQALDQAIITTQLPTSGTVPPSTSSLGYRYNTTALYVQSRPTTTVTNAANVLKATLVNNIGQAATTLTITYDFAVTSPQTGVDELPGWYAYYSLSGLPNTWLPIPQLSGVASAGSLTATVDLSANPWPAGTSMYILWADDNDEGDTDTGFVMDNVVFSASSGPITPFLGISTPTNNSSFNESVPIVVNTISAGMSIVSFYVDGSSWFDDDTPPFTTTLSNLTVGAHQLTAVGTLSAGGTLNATNNPINFTILANQPPSIQITNPPNGFSVLVGTAITNRVNATDDLAVTKVEWYLDGNLVFTRLAPAWVYTYNDSLVGAHTIFARAYDAAGLSADSAAITVNVTNPPAASYTVVIPNGSDWSYYAGTAAPPVDGANAPWNSYFYDIVNVSGWVSGVAEFGNGDGDQAVGGSGDSYPETTAIDIGPSTDRYDTIYFRKTFIPSEDPVFWTGGLIIRLLRDDGAVVYINGETANFAVFTNGITVTALPVPYSTMAANAGDDGTVYQDLLIPASEVGRLGLSSGQDVIAVEVHQSSQTSSDLSFDLMLWGFKYSPPTVAITSPTNNQTFGGGCGAPTIPVNVTASVLVTNVSVFVDGVLAGSDATRPFSVMVPANPGAHQITAQGRDDTGALSPLSAAVTINVLANVGPAVALTNIYSQGVTGTVFAVGSAVVAQFSATDPDGTITNIEFLVNGTVHLRAASMGQVTVGDALAGVSTYQVRAYDSCGVVGLSAPINVTVTNPPAPMYTLLVTNGSSWKYTDDGQTNATLDWTTLAFSDSGWKTGLGEFGYGDSDPSRTLLARTNTTTGWTNLVFYLRHTFSVGNPSDFTNVIVRVLRDDGAQVYLNGNVVVTTPSTFPPTAAVGGNDEEIFFDYNISPSALVAGPNILAVDLRQEAVTSSDVSFDLMLWGQGAGGPKLNIAMVDHDGNPATPPVPEVTWSDPGCSLIESTDITVPRSSWAVRPTTGTSYRPNAVGAQMFYSLRCP